MATPEQIQRALANAQQAGDPAAVARLSAALGKTQPPAGGVSIGQQNPYAMPKAAADLASTQQGMANDTARLGLDQSRANMDAQRLTMEMQAKQREADTTAREQRLAFAPMEALGKQMRRTWDTYAAGPGSTAPNTFDALRDFNPISEGNAQFNTASKGIGQIALGAFRVPGAGTQSDAELKNFIEANEPAATDTDATIKEKLANIERRMGPIYAANGKKFAPYRPKGMIGGGAPVAAPAAMGAKPQTATNPQTGETVMWNGSSWVKAR